MIQCKGSTKKGQTIAARYTYNEGYYLDDVYGRYSKEKKEAWQWCHTQFSHTPSAKNFHICSHNDQNFTVGWEYTDPDTGHDMIRLETSTYTYIVDMEV